MYGVKEQVEKFRRQLRAVHFAYDVDFQGMVLGQPAAFVSFYRRLLCDHSTKLTKHLVEKGFGLLGLADDRLMEAVYRIMRDLLNTRAPITLAQFHSPGFTERKLEMASMLTERLCSLLPTKLSQKSGPQRSTSTSGNPNRVTEVRSLPVHDHVQRVRKCHSIPQVLPDVLPPTSNPGADYALDRVTIKSSDGTGRLLDARQFLHTEIGSTAFPESRVSGDCNDTNDNQFQKPAVTFDTHVWGEESHNQITQPNGKTGNRIAKQQENQCSTFSAMIDSVGQMNQSQRLQSECSGYSMPYAKTGNSYYLLNSNPRPYCYSSSVPKTGKPAPLSNNRPPVKRTALAARTTISSTPSSRMSSSFHRWPSGQAPPTEDEPEAPAMTPPRNPMEEILTSLSKLTGKVDTMLTRLTSLELRLPRVDRGLSTARFCESNSRDASEEPRSFKPAEKVSDGNEPRIHPSGRAEFSLVPFTVAATGPYSTTLVESTLTYPKPQLTPPSSQTASSTTTSAAVAPCPFAPLPMSPRTSVYPQTVRASPLSNSITANAPSKQVPSVPANRLYDDRISPWKFGKHMFNGNRRDTSWASASGIEETVQSSSNFLYTQANIAHNQPNDKGQKQVSADFPIHANATSLPVSPNQPSAQPNFQLDPYLGRFKKPALFRYTDSFEYSANNSLENRPPSSRSVGAGNESADFELASHVSDAYRAQVDRITTMLAETQGLLEAQHMKVVNRAA
ncbi:hypothetical protein CSKR_112079 [Clonorchis sinensis]|uniref:Centrosomal protein of 44 kDa n=1 Tax=Clonorchis sinensis TaxID=79923 RepID=A0A8T1MR36_CLOSI|nr:hypothetical protein CSKR_112079 [Clonorchis sinensis]